MSNNKLPNQIQDILKRHSQSSLLEHFDKVILKSQETSVWLPIQNRYTIDTIDKIKRDTSEDSEPDHKQLNEYIAASVLPHSLDAWTYFGRAISVMLNGDISTAKHLLYYSELRSAIGILASQGIGVFDYKHFIIDSVDSCEKVSNRQTHKFAWKALDFWIKKLNAPELILNNLYPERDINLKKWLQAFNILSATKEDLIKSFLLELGFDLRIFTQDHDARNLVSYRPTSISELSFQSYKTILEQIKLCWKLCEPDSSNGLKKLDEILLKKLLQVSFQAIHQHNRSHRQAPVQFENKIEKMLSDLGMEDLRKEYWLSYFKSNSNSEDIFTLIQTNQNIRSGDYIFGMLFRCLFLLRISSLLGKYCLNNSENVNDNSLDFWTEEVIKNYGLAEEVNSVTYFEDFWRDISVQLEDLETWLEEAEPNINHYNFQVDNPISIPRFSSFERVCLWSIIS